MEVKIHYYHSLVAYAVRSDKEVTAARRKEELQLRAAKNETTSMEPVIAKNFFALACTTFGLLARIMSHTWINFLAHHHMLIMVRYCYLCLRDKWNSDYTQLDWCTSAIYEPFLRLALPRLLCIALRAKSKYWHTSRISQALAYSHWQRSDVTSLHTRRKQLLTSTFSSIPAPNLAFYKRGKGTIMSLQSIHVEHRTLIHDVYSFALRLSTLRCECPSGLCENSGQRLYMALVYGRSISHLKHWHIYSCSYGESGVITTDSLQWSRHYWTLNFICRL